MNVYGATSFAARSATTYAMSRFYATRGTNPDTWYARGHFDDLPERYWQYVNTTTQPYDRHEGEPPALDDGEIDAVVEFLGTLNDREIPTSR